MHRLHRRWNGDTRRFDRFLRANKIRSLDLAEAAGVSITHLGRLRTGKSDPTRSMMIWLTIAARRVLGRHVDLVELFDLGDGEP